MMIGTAIICRRLITLSGRNGFGPFWTISDGQASSRSFWQLLRLLQPSNRLQPFTRNGTWNSSGQ